MESFPISVNLLLSMVTSVACGVIIGWCLFSLKSNKGTSKPPNLVELNNDYIDLTDDTCDYSNGPFKMVIVVRQDLKMGKGKIAAQCAHAAVAAYKTLSKKNETFLRRYERNGQAKVVVKCQDEAELLAIFQHAKTLGLIATVIEDAGRTQITAGSNTVLGVGPGPEAKVNLVTGHLKLL